MNVAHATAVIACRLPIMEQSPGRLVDDGEDTPKANGRNQWIADLGIRRNVNVRFFRFPNQQLPDCNRPRPDALTLTPREPCRTDSEQSDGKQGEANRHRYCDGIPVGR